MFHEVDDIAVTQPPDDSPRRVSLRQFFELAPVYLSIALLIVPTTAIGTLIWVSVSPTRDSFTAAVTQIMVAPLVVVMGWRHRQLLVHGLAVEAIVTEVKESTAMSETGAMLAKYCYAIDGQIYKGDHMFSRWDKDIARQLQPGCRIWILVSPDKFTKSIPWVSSLKSPL